ncbi:SGNH/GDSL hydrolase family protein [Nitrosococcus wardiae]|uniref:SGNH/GDSL hydrolase family protein n=1 Tax=Nitrosococcus wardiae TaxID=1814290 RepID=A0A4V1AVT0_9GAMM|nr:SGNH/GDSL hydrolase family protein [Nitrosococcus wardiae]QBQ54205.1 SGNH/GDSL hydrolase family protein [Nitrosococcus wardiae]
MNKWEQSRPVNQIVLLGASNLSRSLPRIVATAQLICGRPSRFLVAAGHGRSFGVYSRVGGRGLPGITQCGLWEDLVLEAPGPTFALLTDLGNDIAYGQLPEKLMRWVQWCLEQLAECRARTVITGLPLPRLEQLAPWQYYAFRTLLFPGQSLAWEQALARARGVNQALRELCQEQGATFIEQRLEWYGFDPIHILRRQSAVAYYQILSPWKAPGQVSPLVLGKKLRWRWRLWFLGPQYQRLFGFDCYRKQPAGVLPDGSTLSLY